MQGVLSTITFAAFCVVFEIIMVMIYKKSKRKWEEIDANGGILSLNIDSLDKGYVRSAHKYYARYSNRNLKNELNTQLGYIKTKKAVLKLITYFLFFIPLFNMFIYWRENNKLQVAIASAIYVNNQIEG